MIETIESPVKSAVTGSGAQNQPLSECVTHALQNYFTNLAGQPPTDIYAMVLNEIEGPVLQIVMQYTRGNQSRAAILLGLSRGTLRKKLKAYDLLD